MAQAISTMSPVSLTSFYDPYDGSVLSAKLYFYHAATLDPITVHTDASLGTPHPQPVLTGGSGRVPPVWVGQLSPDPALNNYRVRTFDQYDQLLEDIDNIPGLQIPDEEGGGGGGEVDPDLLYHVGDMFCAFTNSLNIAPRAVMANGGTIGNTLSNATTRASPDTEALFKFLWQQDAPTTADAMLPVLDGSGAPAKGSTADGDWLANKQITLPDLRGRAPIGIDPMGPGLASGRMTGAKFDKVAPAKGSDASVPGASGGTASHTLTMEQITVHTHTVIDPTHNHVVNDPTHDHAVYDPTHAHPFTGFGTADPKWIQGGASSGRWPQAMVTQYAKSDVAIYGKATGITLTGIATGVTNEYAGGKAAITGTTPPKDWTTQPFSLAQPFLALTWYIHLGPKPVTP